MFKNVASQKLIVFAFDSTTNLPKTGDAANLTAYVSKDYGSVTVLGDTSATEMDATNGKGYYLFDLTQAETNADTLMFSAKSSTSNIVVIGAPATVFTNPANFTTLSVDGSGRVDIGKALGTAVTLDTNNVLNVSAKYLAGTALTGRDIGANVLLSPGTGTGQISLSSGSVTVGTNSDKTGYGLSSLESPILESGTAQAGASSTITLRSGASSTSSLFKYLVIRIYGGTGAGQSRVISAYNGATKVATVDTAWTTNPASDSTYAIIGHAAPLLTSGAITNTINLVNTPPDSNGVTTLISTVGSPAGASVSADIAAVKTDTAAVKTQTDKLTFTVANQVDSNVLDWKSSTAPAMTGDAYARLGAPAGASHAADVAAVKTDTAAIKTKTDSLTFTVSNQVDSNVLDWKSSAAPAMTGDAYARLGAPAGASVSADVAAVNAKTTNLPSSPAAVGAQMDLVNAPNATAVTAIQSGLATSSALSTVSTNVSALPTANANADALLKRDWTAVSGEAARSVLNALRFLRNKWSVTTGTLTVTKEDDSTSAWTGTVTTDEAALPVTGNDPS